MPVCVYKAFFFTAETCQQNVLNYGFAVNIIIYYHADKILTQLNRPN